MGSGTYLKRAFSKYGKENFKREILFLALDTSELNELEEIVIEISNAVESQQYYNLKKTAIGGDIFTHHPEKERIRDLRRQQMSGKGNNQYGKPKSQKMIDSVKKANSKKVVAFGKEYNSLTACSEDLGIPVNVVCYRLKSGFNEDFYYLDENGEKLEKEKLKDTRTIGVPKPVYADSKRFNSVTECASYLGVSKNTVKKRALSPNFPDVYYEDGE